VWLNTCIQIGLIVGIAGALKAIQRMSIRRRVPLPSAPLPLAA
jgi:hypothetical protein